MQQTGQPKTQARLPVVLTALEIQAIFTFLDARHPEFSLFAKLLRCALLKDPHITHITAATEKYLALRRDPPKSPTLRRLAGLVKHSVDVWLVAKRVRLSLAWRRGVALIPNR